MGYTHYWRRSKDLTQDQWERIAQETLDIIVRHCDKKRIVLAWDYDAPVEPQPSLWGGPKMLPKPPEVTPDIIRFNGWKDEGHETFYFTRVKPESPSWDPEAKESFDFCKTARKPYDLAVCLVLLSLIRHASDSVQVSSDGDWDHEWKDARVVYKELFGVEVDCPWEEAKV